MLLIIEYLDRASIFSRQSNFCHAHFMGNLPNLRFSGLTLHWRADQTLGQRSFYFGQRYDEGVRKLIPLAVRMHHGCKKPYGQAACHLFGC